MAPPTPPAGETARVIPDKLCAMTSSLVQLAADSSVPKLEENHLPMPHWMYGGIAMLVFLLLLGILWTFRNTASTHQESAGEGEKEH